LTAERPDHDGFEYYRPSMPTLRSALNALAESFAFSILSTIRSSSLEDLHAEGGGSPRRGPARPRGTTKAAPTAARAWAPPGKSGRLTRRSPEQIAKTVDLVAKFVKTYPMGLRSEEIRKTFGLDAREMPRILKEGLSTKKLRSRGQKRATTYSAA
jgi:hypothetical protein